LTLQKRRSLMTVAPLKHLVRVLALLAAAGTFATRATCYAELPWLVRFGRGALIITVITGIANRIGRSSSAKSAAPPPAAPEPPHPNSQLVADAAHEVKTPLTGIMAYLELLSDGEADDEATRAEFLSGIGSQVERLQRAVDELFATALVHEAGGQSLVRTPGADSKIG
jgi:signal transduction histidine kinase